MILSPILVCQVPLDYGKNVPNFRGTLASYSCVAKIIPATADLHKVFYLCNVLQSNIHMNGFDIRKIKITFENELQQFRYMHYTMARRWCFGWGGMIKGKR